MNDRIKIRLEKKNGGNQSELARFVGVTPQAVQKWLSGSSEPKGKNLQRTAEFLEITEMELRYGNPNDKPTASVVKKPSWPFSISYDLYASMPVEERDRLDKLVEFTVMQWHGHLHVKSKKAG